MKEKFLKIFSSKVDITFVGASKTALVSCKRYFGEDLWACWNKLQLTNLFKAFINEVRYSHV